MRFIFPVVDVGAARGVEIYAGTDTCSHQLDQLQIACLKLEVIPLATSWLELPLERSWKNSWAIRWSDGPIPVLNGSSGQLSALLAMVAKCGPHLTQRGWLREDTELWATGSIEVPPAPIPPRLGEVGTYGLQQELQEKFLAFVRSKAPIFVCHCDDATALHSLAEENGIHRVDVDEFLIRVRVPREERRFLVEVQPAEIKKLLDTFFEGLFERNVVAFRIANFLTGLRIPLGILVGLFCFWGDFATALTLYFLGLLTDVADGLVARRRHGTSEFGKKFDRGVDVWFNLTSGIGYCIGAAFVWGHSLEIVMFVILTGGILGTTWLVVDRRCAFPKMRSGWIRFVILCFVVFRLGEQARWQLPISVIAGALTCCGILAGVVTYELDVLRQEIKVGRRNGWCRVGGNNGLHSLASWARRVIG